jgi:cytochrome c oxidase subunit 2
MRASGAPGRYDAQIGARGTVALGPALWSLAPIEKAAFGRPFARHVPATPPIARAAARVRSSEDTMRIETKGRTALKLATGLAVGMGLTAAYAAGTGHPEPWQMNMQTPVTEVAHSIVSFHNWLVWLITAISLFVLALLVIVIVRFNERANPTPSRTAHHSLLEVAWTIVPVLILVLIAIPSFRLLRLQLVEPKADMIVKATGHAWYWEYEYPGDQGGFKFDSNIAVEDFKDATPDRPRLLEVDNEVVVPVNKVVRVQVTAADVLHAFAMPSFGVKIDAIPGRLNETWFRAEREGVYYGQCSELCGQRHAYMPIVVRVVSEQAYAEWLTEAKTKYARIDNGTSLAEAR